MIKVYTPPPPLPPHTTSNFELRIKQQNKPSAAKMAEDPTEGK